ncbi:MAG: hypothetical protein ABL883_04465 [Terricaulis sp.]
MSLRLIACTVLLAMTPRPAMAQGAIESEEVVQACVRQTERPQKATDAALQDYCECATNVMVTELSEREFQLVARMALSQDADMQAPTEAEMQDVDLQEFSTRSAAARERLAYACAVPLLSGTMTR